MSPPKKSEAPARKPKTPGKKAGAKPKPKGRRPSLAVLDGPIPTPEGLSPGWDADLSDREALFVAAYLSDGKMNGSKAAVAAGHAPASAAGTAYNHLKKPHVQAAINAAIAARKKRLEIDGDDVVARFWSMATADPRAISHTRRVCCRYCHGDGHAYQYTPQEYRAAKTAHAVERAKVLVETGKDVLGEFPEPGAWYDKRRPASPECPECWGEGLAEVWVADARALRDGEALLFEGAKDGKYGIEVALSRPAEALDKVARALRLYSEASGGGDGGDTPAEVLNKLFAEAMQRGRERQQAARAERDDAGFTGD